MIKLKRMKTKLFVFAPLILTALYPIFAFEVIDIIIFGHDTFDFSMPIFLVTIVVAAIGLFVAKGTLKILPILSLVIILPLAWLSMMLSMS